MGIYNIHAGHNPDGKIACGTVGLIKESTEARNVKNELINILRNAGHTVYDCTVDNGTSQNDVLNKIVAKCNSHKVDLDISIHFNSGAKDTNGNNATTGTEVWVYPNGGAETYATNICNAISSLGFKNRGVKSSKDLFVLRKTNAKALLIECCFVDDRDDVNLYNAHNMAVAIAKGLGVNTVIQPTPQPTPTPQPVQTNSNYYPKYVGNTTSITTALANVGEKDTSLNNRKKIASANGISNYSGTAQQNTAMLNLLKQGKLLKVGSIQTQNKPTVASYNYYPKYNGTSVSITTALANVGEKDTSLNHRKKIASANGITNYSGTAQQNNKMVALLKQGKLIRA